MFRDVEFLPEMLNPDNAVYELLGGNFEDTTNVGSAAVQVRKHFTFSEKNIQLIDYVIPPHAPPSPKRHMLCPCYGVGL